MTTESIRTSKRAKPRKRTKTEKWDAAEHLRSNEAIAEFLTAALETEDASFIAHSLGVAARARGMSKIAADTGLAREALYRTLSSGGNPSFDGILRVAKALGIRFRAESVNHDTVG